MDMLSLSLLVIALPLHSSAEDLWFSAPIQACLYGLSKDRRQDVSLEDCKGFCLAATSFACKSIEYQEDDNRQCYLLEDTKASKPDDWQEPCSGDEHHSRYKSMVYLERIEGPRFTPPVKGCIYGRLGSIEKEDVSLVECLELCLAESSFLCNSIEYIYTNHAGKKFCSWTKDTKESLPGPYEEPCRDTWTEMVYLERIAKWKAWSEWSECSSECGHGTRTRVRICSDPSPSEGGLECPENNKQEENCVGTNCGVSTIKPVSSPGWPDYEEITTTEKIPTKM